MIQVTIEGPMYVTDHSNVTYTAMVSPASPEMKIVWFKDDKEIKQFPGEDQFTLKLFDVEAPAKGVYKAMASIESTSESSTSNEITLDVGADYKEASAYVDLNPSHSVLKNQSITITPVITEVTPQNARFEYTWKYEGLVISNEKSLTVRSDPATPYRRYQLEVKVSAEGSYNPSNYTMMTIVKEESKIDPEPSDFDPRYIHDLRPGRDRGYIWIGWWVHDEIIEAQIDRFDWMADPTNDRFKYKEELETLVYGFSKWPDLEMQESRNGYILRKEDVEVV